MDKAAYWLDFFGGCVIPELDHDHMTDRHCEKGIDLMVTACLKF
jgi:hypothetical protein